MARKPRALLEAATCLVVQGDAELDVEDLPLLGSLGCEEHPRLRVGRAAMGPRARLRGGVGPAGTARPAAGAPDGLGREDRAQATRRRGARGLKPRRRREEGRRRKRAGGPEAPRSRGGRRPWPPRRGRRGLWVPDLFNGRRASSLSVQWTTWARSGLGPGGPTSAASARPAGRAGEVVVLGPSSAPLASYAPVRLEDFDYTLPPEAMRSGPSSPGTQRACSCTRSPAAATPSTAPCVTSTSSCATGTSWS